MTDLIAVVLASLPVLAFAALVVETVRLGSGRGDYPATDPSNRAYGA
jgi:hypothetical protein